MEEVRDAVDTRLNMSSEELAQLLAESDKKLNEQLRGQGPGDVSGYTPA